MTITTDSTTSAGKVRLMTGDKFEDHLFFTDQEIESFLSIYDGEEKLAAAAALDSMASMTSVIEKKIESLDLKTDGPAVAKSLRNHAEQLREQAYSEPAFEVAEVIDNHFQYNEFIWKEALRNG